ncbi:hypothetical protein F4808DRAFT_425644 [Astrocystis sublimbata]|nr:hypothetical protein F4808DRAFT_425644 [Astrocystis sublimbata]
MAASGISATYTSHIGSNELLTATLPTGTLPPAPTATAQSYSSLIGAPSFDASHGISIDSSSIMALTLSPTPSSGQAFMATSSSLSTSNFAAPSSAAASGAGASLPRGGAALTPGPIVGIAFGSVAALSFIIAAIVYAITTHIKKRHAQETTGSIHSVEEGSEEGAKMHRRTISPINTYRQQRLNSVTEQGEDIQRSPRQSSRN